MNGPAHMFIFVPVYRYGIAVIGRTEFQLCLASQEAMLASKLAFVSAKNIFTSCSRVWLSRVETYCACRHQWPGGVSECGPSFQYSAIIFCISVRLADIFTRSVAWVLKAVWPRV